MSYHRQGQRPNDRGFDRNDRGPDRGFDRGGDRGGHHRGGGGGGQFQKRRGIPLSELDSALTDISRRVIGCAIEVHMELGPGFPDDIYRQALLIELQKAEIKFKQNHDIIVFYDDKEIGKLTVDLLVEEKFVLGVLARPGDVHIGDRRGIMAQLRELDLDLGLIINFGERRLKDGLVRVLNMEKIRAMREDQEGDENADGAESDPHDDDEVEVTDDE